MKRYLILGVGYNHVAVPYASGPELAALMGALADGQQVTSSGYGDDQRWVPTSKEPLQMQLIDGDRVTIGDELETLKAQLKAATEEAATNSKRWLDSYAKNQELEKQLKASNQTPAPTNPVQWPVKPDDTEIF